ncbi:hypothetical protein HY480_01275 [Candidatus Uhrbacteria bacterium]|nr:hypothetical protein [Candidatus Uhrbacteria bacterium]
MAPKRTRARAPWYERLAAVFLVLAGVLAAAAFIVSLARVRIVITPRVEHITQDFELTIVGSGPVSGNQVLGRLIRVDGTAEVSVALPPTASVPPTASGALVVTLVNTQPAPQPLVATTRLVSPEGVQFRIVRGATIPARGRLPNVAVTYDAAARQPANADLGVDIPRRYTIPGLSSWLRERVWAESVGAMVASSPTNPPVAPAPAGMDGEVLARADATRRASLLAKTGEEVIVLETTVQVTSNATTKRAVATATALIVDRGAMAARAREVLTRSVAAGGRELIRLSEGAPTVRVVSQDAKTGRATVSVHAEGDVVLRQGSQAFEARRIAGFTEDGIRTYLRSVPGVADVEVSLWPFWVQRVPTNVRTVDVEVRNP